MSNLLASCLRSIDEALFFPLRRRELLRRLCPLLPRRGLVLDLGSSAGHLARALSARLPGTCFLGLDTHIQPDPLIPMACARGQALPFPDRTFNRVMLIDVLHHDEHPERILREAARVSKGDILLKEHYWEHALDRQLLRVSDWLGNWPYGIRMPYRFMSLNQLYALFEAAHLRVRSLECLRFAPIDPAKHLLVRLGRDDSSRGQRGPKPNTPPCSSP
ncbi:MAG: class I SAM-dependent methyltransferase [Anaerolineae bacterium]|nr:class I SAM-dependent methyltransferase [Anaerolineae bacterium]